MQACARASRLAVSILAALVLAFGLAPAAQATFPGANGRIAFSSERDGNPEIYTINVSGGGATRLTVLASNDLTPVWNQAGSDIAFASDRGPDHLEDFEIYRMASNGSGVGALTNNLLPDTSPSWAPSGTQLVIVQQDSSLVPDLLILEADGSGATTDLTGSLPVSAASEPDWSPNGERIAFAASPDGGPLRDIFTVTPNGMSLTNLTNSPTRDDREPSWSPNSAQIAYSSLRNSNYDIHTMNADGTGDVNRSDFPGADDRQPVWSPDGTRIAFVSRRTFNNDDLYSMPSGGGSASQFTIAAGPDLGPDWQRVPPPACSDGLDNDGDTKIDFPADPGCTSSADDDETDPPPTACSDGLDNDGDTKIDFPADPGCTSASDNDEFNSPPGGPFVRPKSASPVKVPLVPGFNACTAPNRTHGPPLAFPSCNPPAQSSTAVTVGTPENNSAPDNSVGSVKLRVDRGVPGPPEDSDISVMGSVTDVRCIGSTTACGNANTSDGADYTGQLQGTATVRITDRWNAVAAGGGADGATVVDIPFPIPFTCASTADADIGGLCTANTSINGIVPGAVKDQKRAIWELGQVIVNDGGPDGQTSTAPNTAFLRQGVFVP